jgi:hypothetical protein
MALYVAVNVACLHALGADGLAATPTPASSVMRMAFGERGAALIAVGIAISTLGFLSQGMLTAPRVYFAMAEDGLFFRRVAVAGPAHARAGGGDHPPGRAVARHRPLRQLRPDPQLRRARSTSSSSA